MPAINALNKYSTKGLQTSTAGVANIAGFKASEADRSDHWKGGPRRSQSTSGGGLKAAQQTPFRGR